MSLQYENRLSPEARECARLLLSLIDLTNQVSYNQSFYTALTLTVPLSLSLQTTGDSISDMLIVQAILSRKQVSYVLIMQ